MRKKWRIPLFLLLLAIATGALYLANREPSYNGRSLSSWVKDFRKDEANNSLSPAREAVRHIGTNALPYLLKELSRKDSPAKRKLLEWNGWVGSHLDHDLIELTPAEVRRSAALEAFRALGSNGVSAIPALCRDLNDKDLAEGSAIALAHIGQPALPAIREHVASTNNITRRACAFALLEFTNATELIPTFQKLAADTQPEVRSLAAYGMGQFPFASETSVLILTNLLGDANEYVKRAALNAIGKFGTNALPAAPALFNTFFSTPRNVLLQRLAGSALRQTGPTSVPFFLTLLAHTNGGVRAEAVRQLASIRDEATNHVPEMLFLLHDPDEDVRLDAILALRTIQAQPNQFIPALIEVIRLEEDEPVLDACLALVNLNGSTASNALPVLIERAKNWTEDSRDTHLLSRDTILLTIAIIDESAAKKLGATAALLDRARLVKNNEFTRPGALPISPPPPPP